MVRRETADWGLNWIVCVLAMKEAENRIIVKMVARM
jgi:hypothetical protein